ncbi:hypothetical protein A3F06_02570 [candidate division TM6 bacterium RIFCSPHIGHO2_12_FULL_36_22]|nr:MAG: hypothetical protein A3F06_02570 [candidate division TM6 bacterium RIFCSPHIGHO2_12_FULL_36_22]
MNKYGIKFFLSSTQYKAFFFIELLVSISIILLLFTMLHIYYAQSTKLLIQSDRTHKALTIASSTLDRMLHAERYKLSHRLKPFHDTLYTITTEKKKYLIFNQDLSWLTVTVSWNQGGVTRKVQLSSAG